MDRGSIIRIPIFPLPGAILFPGLQLPLHIFEPRYRDLVGSALAKDRLIGMIQPQQSKDGAPLYDIGCLGRIGDVEALEARVQDHFERGADHVCIEPLGRERSDPQFEQLRAAARALL